MNTAEKKLRVTYLDPTKTALQKLGAKLVGSEKTTHIYAARDDGNVTKLVVYDERSEIHELTQTSGTFELTSCHKVNSREAGIKWLKAQGYTKFRKIIMNSTTYKVLDGTVGLYTINSQLKSVIIDAPSNRRNELTKQLSLENSEVISLPFDQYLASRGQLDSFNL